MSISELKQQLSIDDIMRLLPHRYPFLLVDRVLNYEPSESIIGIKNVTINEHFFSGHFPIKPVMPGVLIAEALAQLGGILAYVSTNWKPEESLFYLGTIDNCKFKQVVTPGDQLQLEVNVMKKRSKVWKFKGVASVNDKIVCSSDITCAEGKVE